MRTSHYYVDSTKLPVCDNRRIHSNKVFQEIATRGRGSTGWYYGLKLHLVTKQHGELMRFLITPTNVADNNQQVLSYLFKGLTGKCYGDKGYFDLYTGRATGKRNSSNHQSQKKYEEHAPKPTG